MEDKIKWTVDHSGGFVDDAWLIGDYNGTRFLELFNTNSWFSFGLMFAKWKITRRFKIIYKQEENERSN